MTISMLGIDIAKNTFQLHGADNSGKAVHKKRLARRDLAAHVANIPACTIVMEACARAVLSHYKDRDNDYTRWVGRKKSTLSHNKAAVALANKNARIIWSMLSSGEEFNYGVQTAAA